MSGRYHAGCSIIQGQTHHEIDTASRFLAGVDHKGTKTARMEPIPETTNRVSRAIVDAALAVHGQLGAGLLESIYERCLAHELHTRGHAVARQVCVPVVYRELRLDNALRIDLLVDNCLIVEIKAVNEIVPVHTAQLLTYLKLSKVRLGLLINFNVLRIRDGIRRVAL